MKLSKNVFISQQLIEQFEQLFPNKLPLKRDITTEQIAFLQGQQSVIERMKFIYNDENLEEN